MDLSANMFYKVKFSVAAKDKSDDLLWKIVLHIMNWQTTKWNKKGKTILTDNLHAWSDIKNGSRILTKSNIVYIESDCFWEGQETVTKWACKITETPPLERRVAPRTWITEIGFEREKGNDSAVFSCVLSYEDRAGFIGPYQKVPEPSVPRLIKSIVQDNSLIVSSGIDSVSGKPERLYVGDWPAFLDRIENEERSLPYIYISPRVVDVEPLTTELLIDPNALAEVVYGNALVFYSNDIGFTQEAIYMNPEYACYNGAIKVYQPGASKSFRNHFIGAQQIEECGSDEIIGYLRRAFSQNVHFYDSFFRIEECRRIKENYLTNTRFSQQFARITALVNQVKFDANAKVGQIEEEALTMLQQEEQSRLAAEKDRDEYKNENTKLRSKVYSLETQVAQMTSAAMENEDLRRSVEARMLFSQKPDTVESVVHYFEEVFSDKIVFSDDAKKSLKYCILETDILWEVLFQLSTVMWSLYTSGSGDICSTFTEITGISCASGEGKMTRRDHNLMKQFETTLGKERIDIEKHITYGKKGQSIHFGYSPVLKRIVIGHCGEHLDIASTPKRR